MNERGEYEREYLKRREIEEKEKAAFLDAIQELIDKRDAANQPELQPQHITNISRNFQGKSQKDVFEEYEERYLEKLTEHARKSAEMIRKAKEMVKKKLSQSEPQNDS